MGYAIEIQKHFQHTLSITNQQDDSVRASGAQRRPARWNAGQQAGNFIRLASGYAGHLLRHRSLTGVAGSVAHTDVNS